MPNGHGFGRHGAVFDEVAGPVVEGHGALLGADLGDAFVFAGGLDHLASFGDGEAHGFFDVDVHAGVHGVAGDPGACVGGGFDHDAVELFFFDPTYWNNQ